MSATAEQIIFSLLTADTALSAIVGKNIFPQVAHEGDEQHWIVYARVSNVRVHSMDGFDNLSATRYQITGWSIDSAVRGQIREAILRILDETLTEVNGTEVHFVHDNDMDEFEEGPPKKFGARIDFKVWM